MDSLLGGGPAASCLRGPSEKKKIPRNTSVVTSATPSKVCGRLKVYAQA